MKQRAVDALVTAIRGGMMDKDQRIAELEAKLQWYETMYKSTKFPVRFRIRDLVITIDRVEGEKCPKEQ